MAGLSPRQVFPVFSRFPESYQQEVFHAGNFTVSDQRYLCGGQYALIAIGYTLVYGILRLINFAHGDVFMVAGLIMVYTTASMPMYISIPLVLIFYRHSRLCHRARGL